MNKKIITIIVACVIILGIGGLAYSLQDRLPSNAILDKDPQLTDQEKQVINDKISEYKNITSDTSKSKEDRYKAYVQTGLQYFILGKYVDARLQYIEATKLLPENSTAWAELYVVENAMQAYDLANKHIKKAITYNSANPQFWRWYLELAGPLNVSTEKVDTTYQEALKQTESSADILALYAKFLEERKNDLAGAVTQLKLAIEKNPANQAQYQAEIERIQSKLK